MGRTAWRDIRAKAKADSGDPEAFEARAAAARKANEEEESRFNHTLAQLRKARLLTQAEVAAELGVEQPVISKLERQADLYLSSLARYVRGLGGRLVLTAEFDGESYELEIGDLTGRETLDPEATAIAAAQAAPEPQESAAAA